MADIHILHATTVGKVRVSQDRGRCVVPFIAKDGSRAEIAMTIDVLAALAPGLQRLLQSLLARESVGEGLQKLSGQAVGEIMVAVSPDPPPRIYLRFEPGSPTELVFYLSLEQSELLVQALDRAHQACAPPEA